MNMHRAYCGLTVVTNEQGHTDHAAAVTIGRILCCAYRCRLACDYCVVDCVVCGQRRATIADNRWQYVSKTPRTEGRAFDPGESGISRRSKLLCTVGLLCQHAELVVYDAGHRSATSCRLTTFFVGAAAAAGTTTWGCRTRAQCGTTRRPTDRK